ncbi:TPA: hypothetical protein ACX6PJ_001216 [Photobacterium damselae]
MDKNNNHWLNWKVFFIVIALISVGIFIGWLIFSKSSIQSSFTFNELVSLNISVILGSVSIILGVFAIWLTLHLKSESDILNKKTEEYLSEIKTNSKIITDYALKELNLWGEVSRQTLNNNATGAPAAIKSEKTSHPNKTESENKSFQFQFGTKSTEKKAQENE